MVVRILVLASIAIDLTASNHPAVSVAVVTLFAGIDKAVTTVRCWIHRALSPGSALICLRTRAGTGLRTAPCPHGGRDGRARLRRSARLGDRRILHPIGAGTQQHQCRDHQSPHSSTHLHNLGTKQGTCQSGTQHPLSGL